MITDLPLQKIKAYLTNRKWEEKHEISYNDFVIGCEWQNFIDEKEYKIFVSSGFNEDDYRYRTRELIRDLSRIEKREEEQIIRDIIFSNYDIFRVIIDKDKKTDNLQLEQFVNLTNNVLNIYSYSALSINNPKLYYQSKYPKDIMQYREQIRLGHTEKGSFIVNFQIPIVDNIESDLLKDIEEDKIENEPFERQVNIRMCNLIQNSIDVIEKKEKIDNVLNKGISANFLEAFGNIIDACGSNGTNFKMSWSNNRPIKEQWKIRNEFNNISHDYGRILKDYGKQLKEKIPIDDVEIKGYCIKLHKETKCEITILDNENGKINLEIKKDEIYKKIVDAHKDGKLITIKGRLTKGKSYTLENFEEKDIIIEE
ncbi:MAG: hypothetical protein LBH46_03850 [Rickettsiales bacterium]|jgi:hypothetical protein|nr:hypothetical protein [Rickettsiales bacterium]